MSDNHLTIEASRIIAAPVETIYDIIADYRGGHKAILPQPYFTHWEILAGGYGAGTEIKLTIEVYGQQTHYHQLISEPEPGRVIREQDQLTDQYTEFRLEPLADNTQTRVTIFSAMPVNRGIKGLLERWFQPGIVRNIFQKELGNLAEYVKSA